MRKLATLIFCVLFAGVGFWGGESGLPIWAVMPLVSGFVGCVMAVLIMPGVFWKRALVGVGSLALFVVTFSFGAQSFVRAFGECVERGEEVRTLLKNFYENKNQYPESLSELKQPLPCGRITRPTILNYEKNKTGYLLTFKDWLIEFMATESNAFIAYK